MRGDARAAAPGADALFGGIEAGRALGADRWAAAQIVELRPAVRADLLGAQIGLGQTRSPSARAGRPPHAGRSLATIGRACQKLCPALVFRLPDESCRHASQGAICRTIARPRPAPGGQVDLPPRADHGRPGGRAKPESSACWRARTFGTRPRPCVASARRVEQRDDGRWVVTGAGGFSQPSETIDCGNSGTARAAADRAPPPATN